MYTIKIRFNTEHAKSGESNGLLWRLLIQENSKPPVEHLASSVKFTRGCFTTSDEIAHGVIKQHITAETDVYPFFETEDDKVIVTVF